MCVLILRICGGVWSCSLIFILLTGNYVTMGFGLFYGVMRKKFNK